MLTSNQTAVRMWGMANTLRGSACPQFKHGWADTPTYSVWRGIVRRHADMLCAEWAAFPNFKRDMGEKPKGKGLVRIDRHKEYSPENCRWAVRKGIHSPSYRHGATSSCWASKTYIAWSNMVQRTTNPKHKHFGAYGGRGIGVCERWLLFPNFLEDMGDKPDGLTLERIDNDQGYCPENCRWATRRDQTRNRRNTLRVQFRGTETTLGEVADKFSIPYHSIYNLLRDGYGLEEIVAIRTQTKDDMIHKNTPIPEQRETHQAVAKEMKIGDSVIFGSRAKAKGMQQALKTLGFSGCVRHTERGFRVWRTK